VTTPPYTLKIAKEDLKFSAAHFTLFPDGSGELLHGHNYSVSIAISGTELDEAGLLVDIAALKKHVRSLCKSYDERTLIPTESPWLKVEVTSEQIEVRFGKSLYSLPRKDVVLLPLANLTMELLAKHLWKHTANSMSRTSSNILEVEVQETAGQSCAYRNSLSHQRDSEK